MSRSRSREAARGRLVRRLAWPLLLAVVTGGVLVLGVFPTRTYLDQRRTVAAAEARLRELEDTNRALEAEVRALDDDAEIERLAREQYGLARPGEEVYRILPPAQDPVVVPRTWPFNGLAPER